MISRKQIKYIKLITTGKNIKSNTRVPNIRILHKLTLPNCTEFLHILSELPTITFVPLTTCQLSNTYLTYATFVNLLLQVDSQS